MRRCRCPKQKRLYRDRVAALVALAEIERKDRPTAKECRAYRCPSGAGYHLTSQRR